MILNKYIGPNLDKEGNGETTERSILEEEDSVQSESDNKSQNVGVEKFRKKRKTETRRRP